MRPRNVDEFGNPGPTSLPENNFQRWVYYVHKQSEIRDEIIDKQKKNHSNLLVRKKKPKFDKQRCKVHKLKLASFEQQLANSLVEFWHKFRLGIPTLYVRNRYGFQFAPERYPCESSSGGGQKGRARHYYKIAEPTKWIRCKRHNWGGEKYQCWLDWNRAKNLPKVC